MAFGKAPDPKVLKQTPNVEDQLWRAYVESEQTAAAAWQSKWGWILTEYGKLNEKLEEVTKNSLIMTAKSKELDTRTIKPVPNSVSHEYGWLAARKEFKLEKYGPDFYKGMPFVSLGS